MSAKSEDSVFERSQSDSDLKQFDKRPSETHSEKDFHRQNMYQCFCCKIDKRAALFFSQLALTLLMLGFCFTRIYSTGDTNSGPVWGLIGTFIGFWFDSPKLQDA